MDTTKFTLGFQIGENYDYKEKIHLTKELRKELKKEFPNISIDFNWSDPTAQEVTGYAFEITGISSPRQYVNNHAKALDLKEKVYNVIGWLLGDFHM